MMDNNCRLEKCFRSKVEIDCELKNDADRIYDLVKSKVRNYIFENVGNKVSLVDMGSSFESLKVVAPDEYDVMLVVHNTGLQAMSSHVPGYNFIKRLYPSVTNEATYPSWRWIDFDKCISDGYLSPDLVRQSFQSMMHRFLNQHQDSSYTLRMRQSGPAIEVSVTWSGKSMTIDFVPTVNIMGEMFVSKPIPQNISTINDKNLWRKSNSPQEREVIAGHLSENWRKATMLWKTARMYSTQLQFLSSYHFKTIAMRLAARRVSPSLEDSVRAIGEELAVCLKQENLPHLFIPEVNLFQLKSTDSLQNLQRYMSNRLNDKNIVPFIVNLCENENKREGVKETVKEKEAPWSKIYMLLLTSLCVGIIAVLYKLYG